MWSPWKQRISMSLVQLTPKAVLKGCLESLPLRKTIDSVVMILDLSGYTSVTRTLIEQANQPNASEYIGRLIKHFFDPIFELIGSYGGDIVKYAGDAVICLFQDSKDAVHCCIEATRYVRDNPLLDLTNKMIPLAVHSVVHYGNVDLIFVGDLQYLKRAEFVCHGKAYTEACSLLDSASKDEILVTNEAWQEMSLPSTKHGRYRTITFKSSFPSQPPISDYSKKSIPLQQDQFSITSFVDKTAQLRHETQSSEIRQTSVVFLKLIAVNRTSESNDALDYLALQDFFIAAVQTCGEKVIIRQLTVDDKGISLLLLSGMPPATSENPCLSVACITLKILSTIEKLRLPFYASCGLATGRLFSGFIGTETRKEHAILGGAINLAARFMSKAPKDCIWCDTKSFELIAKATALVQTRQLPSVSLKGWKDPVTVYSVEQPVRVANTNSKEVLNKSVKSLDLVREPSRNAMNVVSSAEVEPHAEYNSSVNLSIGNAFVQIDFHNEESDKPWKEHIDKWLKLDKTAQASWSNPIVIEGPSGAGKSTAAARIASKMQQNVVLWTVQSFEIEQAIPFSCTRQILEKMMSYYEANDLMHLCELLSIDARHRKTIVSDLKIFMQSKVTAISTAGSALPASQESNATSPDYLIHAATEAIVGMLANLPFRLIIMFDDCQWQDRYSWAITVALKRVQVILVSRPPREYIDPSMKELFINISTSPQTCRIQVGQVSQADIRRIVSTLKFPHVEELSERLYQLSSGNAFALDVLLKHLREQRNKLADSLADGMKLLIDTRSVFVSQLDSLEPKFQRLVRSAALIGQVFHLTDIIALNADMNLSYDMALDLIQNSDKYGFLEPLSDGSRWRFRHCLICIQIVNIMTVNERLQRQRLIAEYFETQLTKMSNNQGSSRKPELLPLVLSLYTMIDDQENRFRIACRLINMYYKLDMRFECRKMIHLVVSEPKRFKQLERTTYIKICRIGLDLSRSLADPDLCKLFLAPCCVAFTGVKLEKCALLAILQLMSNINKMDKFWKQNNPTYEEDKRDSETKEKTNSFWRLITEFVDAPDDFVLTINQLLCNVLFILSNLKYGPNAPQWVETMMMSVVLLYTFGKCESGDRVFELLQFTNTDSEAPIMKMISKFGDMSLKENMRLVFPFRAVIRLFHFINNMFKVDYERSYRIGYACWKVALKFNTAYMIDSAVLLSAASIIHRSIGCNAPDDILVQFIHMKRLYVEQHPSSMSEIFGTRATMANYIRLTSELVQGDDFLNPLPEGVVLDRNDYEFACQYLQKLNETNGNNLLPRISTASSYAIVYACRGRYEECLDQVQIIVDGLEKIKKTTKLVLYSLFLVYNLRTFSFWLFHLHYSNKIPNDSQKKRAEELFVRYMKNSYQVTKNKSNWKRTNLAESGFYITSYCLELYKGNYKKSVQTMELARKELLKIHSHDALEVTETMLMLCKAEVPIFGRPYNPKNSLPSDCIKHYEAALSLCKLGNRFWTERHLKRIAKAIGI